MRRPMDSRAAKQPIPLFYSAPASVYLGRALVTRGEAVYGANPASRMMERCGRDASIE